MGAGLATSPEMPAMRPPCMQADSATKCSRRIYTRTSGTPDRGASNTGLRHSCSRGYGRDDHVVRARHAREQLPSRAISRVERPERVDDVSLAALRHRDCQRAEQIRERRERRASCPRARPQPRSDATSQRGASDECRHRLRFRARTLEIGTAARRASSSGGATCTRYPRARSRARVRPPVGARVM